MEFKGCVAWNVGNYWRGVVCSTLSPTPSVLGKYLLDEIQSVGTNKFLQNIKMLSSFDDYIKGERCPFCGFRGVGSVVDVHPALLQHEFVGGGEYPDMKLQYHTHFINASKQLVSNNSNPYEVLYVYVIDEDNANIKVYKSFKEDLNTNYSIDYGIGKYNHSYIGTIDYQTDLTKFDKEEDSVKVDCAQFFTENNTLFTGEVCNYCTEKECNLKASRETLKQILIKYNDIFY